MHYGVVNEYLEPVIILNILGTGNTGLVVVTVHVLGDENGLRWKFRARLPLCKRLNGPQIPTSLNSYSLSISS